MLQLVLCIAGLGLAGKSQEVKVGPPETTCPGRGGCSCDCSWASPDTCKADDKSCCFGCCCLQYCAARGACECECSWASPDTCKADDGSCCFGCCCGSQPTPPTPPSPTPAPPTPPTPTPPTPPTPSGPPSYCPSASDLTTAWDTTSGQNVFLKDQGWMIHGGGGAATKSTFNLLGGSVEYDIDVGAGNIGVNQNIYSIYPHIDSSGYQANNYCDGAATGDKWCVEVDWIESNGHCGGQTTLHTKQGPGNDGCTAWGCQASYHYNGRTSFHMKIEFATDGTWTTTRDGQVILPSSLNPQPGSSDWQTVVQQTQERGALIYSSQWTGFVPVTDCGTSGDLGSSQFAVSNLVIRGTVVQGPTPRMCS